jgi:hypothetical protein
MLNLIPLKFIALKFGVDRPMMNLPKFSPDKNIAIDQVKEV